MSKWTVSKDSLEVLSGEDLIKQVKCWDGTSWQAATTTLNRLCSADLPDTSAFYNAASGKGTRHRIFMNGEEAGPDCRALGPRGNDYLWAYPSTAGDRQDDPSRTA